MSFSETTTEMTSSDIAAESRGASEAATMPARDRLVINILLVSAFVVILNETIMNVAIPRLMASLDASAQAAQWLTTAFLITTAVVIPVTGFLLQRFNTRPIYIAAMSLFSLGTLMAAVAPNLPLLVVARIVQASGTAIMMPLLMTTVMSLVPPNMRGKVMGNISIVMSMAPAIGPVVSGLILSVLPWRFMFILVLPIALGALWLGGRRMVNVSTPREAPLDIVSVVISAFAFGGLVYGLSNIGEPAGPVPGWLALAVGAAAMVVFVVRQMQLARREAALLDLRTFLSRNFSISVVMMAIAMMAMFGTIIVLPIYMQNVLGLDTLTTGLLLLPGGLLMGGLGPSVGRLYDRIGPTWLIVCGMAIVCAILWGMTLLDQQTSIWVILFGYMAMSVGFALLFTPLFTVSLSSVAPNLYPHGSALLGSIQQVAGAAGVALFVSLMSQRTVVLTTAGFDPVAALAGGVRVAFLTAALIAMAAVVVALFIRRAPDHGPMPVPGH